MARHQFLGGPIRTTSSRGSSRIPAGLDRYSRSGSGALSSPYRTRKTTSSTSATKSLRRVLGSSGDSSVRSRLPPSPEFSSTSYESNLPLTFGVELEFLFALKKKIHRRHAWMYRHEGRYMLNPQPVPTRARLEEEHAIEYRVLPAYLRNKHNFFEIAQKVLQRSGLGGQIAQDDPTNWNIVEDVTIIADSERELETRCPSKVQPGESGNWTTQGVELVSRVLKAPDQRHLTGDRSLGEVKKYVQALAGNEADPYTVYVNKTCGMHVHIGLDPLQSDNSQLPLEVLQHLSYILFQFEALISALHPPHRRATLGHEGGGSYMLGSGLMGISGTKHICNARPLPLLQALEKQIFAADMTRDKLATLMSEAWPAWPERISRPDRYKFVNFRRLISIPSGYFANQPPMTIEFRQHTGTMDIETISYWVHFVTQLVRAAEKKSLQRKPASPDTPRSPTTMANRLRIHMNSPFPRQQGNKYKLRCKYVADELERLFDLLEFDRLTRRYWLDRFVEYNLEAGNLKEREFGLDRLAPGRAMEKECPACEAEKRAGQPGLFAGLFGDQPVTEDEPGHDMESSSGMPDMAALRRLLPGLKWSSDNSGDYV